MVVADPRTYVLGKYTEVAGCCERSTLILLPAFYDLVRTVEEKIVLVSNVVVVDIYICIAAVRAGCAATYSHY